MSAQTSRALIRDVVTWARGRLFRLGLLDTLTAISDMVGILLLVPLVAIASGEMAWPQWFAIGDPLTGFDETARLGLVTALFLAVMLVRAILAFARARFESGLFLDYEHGLRVRYLSQLADGGWTRGGIPTTSHVHTVLISECARTAYAVRQLLGAGAIVVLLAIQGALALYLSPGLTLVALGLLAVMLLASWPVLRDHQARGARIGRALEQSSGESEHLVRGLKTAVAEGRTARFVDGFKHRDLSLVDEQQALAVRQAFGRSLFALLSAAAAAMLILIGRFVFDLPLAILIPMLVLFARLTGPVRQLLSAAEGFLAYSPAFASLALDAATGGHAKASAAPDTWQRLSVNDMIVNAETEFAIGPLDLVIERGEWVGLSGETGSGKTSLIDCLAGLVPADQGQFALDDAPFDPMRNPGWARQIAYAGQGEALLDGTIRDNLMVPDGTSDDRLGAVIAATGLDRMEHGLDTRGALLSGGEAQRVILARSLLRTPNLLILDEATAALDLEAERLLFDHLRAWPDRPAILMIAHRPQSLALMDRIITLQNGQLIPGPMDLAQEVG